MRQCLVEGCTKQPHGRGLCATHYKRWRRHGDADHVEHTSLRGTFAERFWAQIRKRPDEEGGCWEFARAKSAQSPYGRLLGPTGKYMLAHRASWLLHHGHLDDDTAVLHHCDNPPCVRPDHLFLGDRADNNQDMVEKGRHFWQVQSQCPNGHRYTPENTHIYRGRRQCRECGRARHARYNAARARRTPSSRDTFGT